MFGRKPEMHRPFDYTLLGQYQVWRPQNYGMWALVFTDWKYNEALANSNPGDVIAFVKIEKYQEIKSRQDLQVGDWKKA